MDLAGSERVSLTKAAGERLKEGANINKSLSVLGNVIRQLSEGKEFISYRDSKLTRLLSQALGDVYGSVVKPLVDSFMEGFNATIFAYGQTSSGKTHTILGNKTDPGLFQLVSNQLFQHVADQVDKRYLIRCSYIEIYNEKINDLLDKSNQGLTIREDIKGNVLLDAREAVVDNVDKVMENMMQGNKIRRVAATRMNERSSRSHTIFRIILESKDANQKDGPVHISYLNLMDLAGSERVSLTKAAGERLKEGANINKSLSVLGNVIRQLSEGKEFISYRDSKLTRLLSQALGDVYGSVVKPLVDSFMEGFNATIFAYGQTSSGKTHTILGNKTDPGLFQLVSNQLFQHVADQVDKRYLIRCSYIEIYNEKINDLLDKSNQGLTIREDIKGNVLLDAREAVVDNVDKVMENMMQGNKIRRVAATRMNERSSRSHTIFRIILESKDANQKDGPVHISYLNLMDLAGSERVSLTKAAGERLKEGANINKSLSVLGNVIRQLSEGKEFISYRDSKLTRLLSQALGDVYGSVVKPLVDSFMEGFNATIFAYGQTSSGKTHTILGNKTDPGLFQLVSNQLFQHVADQVDKRYLIRCSYIEIYNEKINDLLDKSNQGLTIREDIKGNVLLDAREAVVDNVDKVMENMMQGNKIRRVAATRMNERSSRSHTIFRIILESKDANQKDGPVHISYLNLMDLAGSERVSLTKAAGERLKEGANINKSLSVLGNVIRQLSEGKEFISYRDSKLTRLLSQALGDVYGSVVKPLVDSFMEGFNATIFAYGQTSSGKTHTILGNKTDPGLFQLVSNQLFQHVADQVDKRYLIGCSYIEIYNEKINDLLDKSNQGLTIREDIKGNVLLDAREAVVDNVDQVMENMMQGNKIRRVAATRINERSSRSHTIFRIILESKDANQKDGPVHISYLNLMDLAGSERVSLTKAAGERLKEGANINKSLSVLGNVIRQLSEGKEFISYRDSKLTRLLSQALGDVYGSVVKPLVDSFMEGFNATIFAYGQTSSGKTHTILGNKTDPGLFQLVSNQLFQHVADQVDKRYLIRCSYIEIYNEKINDLLDKSNQGLTIREDIKGNVLLDAREAVVDNVDKVMENMMQGNKIRRVAATRMNERSSRSHTIFRIILESKDANQKDGPVHISYLNLMDLAGSERVSLTKAAGERLKEGANINKSLSVLGNVIRQLSEGKEFISYRDSKLTRLLSQALGDVYGSVVKPLVDSFMEGFNATIFAYGQTSSGKTHTILGNKTDPGLFQLVSNQLFQHVADQVDKRYLIRCSYIEIYNEKINDLLDKSNQGLTIREDIKGNVLLDAREAVVDNVDKVMENMMQGNKIRRVAATRMNERSSRSHTIFRIILESKDANQKDGPVHISYLNLMDLAGSERVSLTKAAGERLKEGANINKSCQY
ncbi:unnamed protein product [Acanthoscelides obtectus]|uniref:Kinesin motor domain-containing protein n=1 Tax=Acanthoscelides obtectus TaxID=200917 RepID=A0A9P0QA00_ACAOB|nr:unnamed protein product [Acanthoscelides obtectus]CAK1682863.1 Centromere-associated protein E [Acanthoscelides obtectus]